MPLSQMQNGGANQKQHPEPTRKPKSRPMSGIEDYEPYYDSDAQPEGRGHPKKPASKPMSGDNKNLPYRNNGRRPMSGIDHYPSFEEIVEHEQWAPQGLFERFDHGKDYSKPMPVSAVENHPPTEVINEHKQQTRRGIFQRLGHGKKNSKRRPVSGVDHYAPMEVINEHEKAFPLALDSKHSTALEGLLGEAEPEEGRSLTQKYKRLIGRAGKAHRRGSDAPLARLGNPNTSTRQDDRPRRQRGSTR